MCIGSAGYLSVLMVPMPSLEVVDIAHGQFTARVIPAWGGRVASLRHAEAGDILVPNTASEFDPLNWPKAGGYPLFPFHNRIKQAAFHHDGVLRHLRPHPALGGDVMHGPAHQRVWQVTSSSSSSVSLRLDFEADADWPFAFIAHQQIGLDDLGLTVHLELVNRSDDPCPDVSAGILISPLIYPQPPGQMPGMPMCWIIRTFRHWPRLLLVNRRKFPLRLAIRCTSATGPRHPTLRKEDGTWP